MFTRYIWCMLLACDECMMNTCASVITKCPFVCMHTEKVIFECRVTLLCASHDPWGWWLAELPASAILTHWSSMLYDLLYSNQWLTTNGPDCELCKPRSINTTDPGGPWGGWDGGGWRSISLLKASASHCRSLERSQSLTLYNNANAARTTIITIPNIK